MIEGMVRRQVYFVNQSVAVISPKKDVVATASFRNGGGQLFAFCCRHLKVNDHADSRLRCGSMPFGGITSLAA